MPLQLCEACSHSTDKSGELHSIALHSTSTSRNEGRERDSCFHLGCEEKDSHVQLCSKRQRLNFHIRLVGGQREVRAEREERERREKEEVQRGGKKWMSEEDGEVFFYSLVQVVSASGKELRATRWGEGKKDEARWKLKQKAVSCCDGEKKG